MSTDVLRSPAVWLKEWMVICCVTIAVVVVQGSDDVTVTSDVVVVIGFSEKASAQSDIAMMTSHLMTSTITNGAETTARAEIAVTTTNSTAFDTTEVTTKSTVNVHSTSAERHQNSENSARFDSNITMSATTTLSSDSSTVADTTSMRSVTSSDGFTADVATTLLPSIASSIQTAAVTPDVMTSHVVVVTAAESDVNAMSEVTGAPEQRSSYKVDDVDTSDIDASSWRTPSIFYDLSTAAASDMTSRSSVERSNTTSKIWTVQMAVIIGSAAAGGVIILVIIVVIAFVIKSRFTGKPHSSSTLVKYYKETDRLDLRRDTARSKRSLRRPPSSPDASDFDATLMGLHRSVPPSAAAGGVNNIFLGRFPEHRDSKEEINDETMTSRQPLNRLSHVGAAADLYERDSDQESLNAFGTSTFCANNNSAHRNLQHRPYNV